MAHTGSFLFAVIAMLAPQMGYTLLLSADSADVPPITLAHLVSNPAAGESRCLQGPIAYLQDALGRLVAEKSPWRFGWFNSSVAVGSCGSVGFHYGPDKEDCLSTATMWHDHDTASVMDYRVFLAGQEYKRQHPDFALPADMDSSKFECDDEEYWDQQNGKRKTQGYILPRGRKYCIQGEESRLNSILKQMTMETCNARFGWYRSAFKEGKCEDIGYPESIEQSHIPGARFWWSSRDPKVWEEANIVADKWILKGMRRHRRTSRHENYPEMPVSAEDIAQYKEDNGDWRSTIGESFIMDEEGHFPLGFDCIDIVEREKAAKEAKKKEHKIMWLPKDFTG